MRHLLAASLIWAPSFGLIKGRLVGVDPVAVAAFRLALAAAAFAPLLVGARLPRRTVTAALALGMLQFGLMYVLYIASYAWLPAWMVAVFTVFTPVYVFLLSDLTERRLRVRHLAAALLAVVGAGVIVVTGLPAGADWRGVVLLQGANLCFAAGQLLFTRLERKAGGNEASLLAWMYQGAALFTVVVMLVRGNDVTVGWDPQALLTVAYLGLVPTALGFYLWNRGAARVGPGLLAGANNLKVPLAVLVSWLAFGESASYARVLLGLAVMVAGLFVAGGRSRELPVRPPR
ncbi:EamA family transporter [bacterium]|nr:MAG: EamA family transporter [bacterium]